MRLLKNLRHFQMLKQQRPVVNWPPVNCKNLCRACSRVSCLPSLGRPSARFVCLSQGSGSRFCGLTRRRRCGCTMMAATTRARSQAARSRNCAASAMALNSSGVRLSKSCTDNPQLTPMPSSSSVLKRFFFRVGLSW